MVTITLVMVTVHKGVTLNDGWERTTWWMSEMTGLRDPSSIYVEFPKEIDPIGSKFSNLLINIPFTRCRNLYTSTYYVHISEYRKRVWYLVMKRYKQFTSVFFQH